MSVSPAEAFPPPTARTSKGSPPFCVPFPCWPFFILFWLYIWLFLIYPPLSSIANSRRPSLLPCRDSRSFPLGPLDLDPLPLTSQESFLRFSSRIFTKRRRIFATLLHPPTIHESLYTSKGSFFSWRGINFPSPFSGTFGGLRCRCLFLLFN